EPPPANPAAALNQKQIAGIRASSTLSATSSTFSFPAPWLQQLGISDPMAAIATMRRARAHADDPFLALSDPRQPRKPRLGEPLVIPSSVAA
ncbi:unnamed protein product, partial [Urochloa humidicola]